VPSLAPRKRPSASDTAPREGAAHVAKELGLEAGPLEIALQFTGDEGALVATREPVDRRRNQLLSGAALPSMSTGESRGRHLAIDLLHALHRLRNCRPAR